MRTVEEITKEIKLYDDYIALIEARLDEVQSSFKRIQVESRFEKGVPNPKTIMEANLLLAYRRTLDSEKPYYIKQRAILKRELAEAKKADMK